MLAHQYHCIVIEARGHGLSSKPLSGYSIQDMAADDAAALAALGVDRAILVGNSMGGMRAMQMSLDYPHLVAGNVIISSATNLSRFLDADQLIASLQEDYEAAADDLVERCFSVKDARRAAGGVPDDQEQFSGRGHLSPAGWRWPAWRTPTACGAGTSPSGCETLRQPTLVLVGEEDRGTPVEANRFLADHIPQAELRIIKDVGHCYEIERPLEFNQELEAFAAKHGH